MSVALIPILMTKRKAPSFKRILPMKLKELYNTSPLGMVSALLYGIIQSALFSLLAVYATSMNFTILEISIATFLLAISGAISQWPIGKLSDIFDRRRVIVYSTFAAGIFAICTIFASGQMYLPDGLSTSKTWFITLALIARSVPPASVNMTSDNGGIPYIEITIEGTVVTSNNSITRNLESFK